MRYITVSYVEPISPDGAGWYRHRERALAKGSRLRPHLDDCPMLPLAVGGSYEKFNLRPNLLVSGKLLSLPTLQSKPLPELP